MAYMSQDRKAFIAASLKRIIPEGWKYSLAVRDHSTLSLTISAAPIDLIAAYQEERAARGLFDGRGCCTVNKYHIDHQFSGSLLATFKSIQAAMDYGNHDRSDLQSDYFDVGWYTSIDIGKWNKPFVCTAAAAMVAWPQQVAQS